MMTGLLSGKTVVLTDSSSGMGRAPAVLARQAGARVIGVDRSEARDHLDDFTDADLSTIDAADRLIDALPPDIEGDRPSLKPGDRHSPRPLRKERP